MGNELLAYCCCCSRLVIDSMSFQAASWFLLPAATASAMLPFTPGRLPPGPAGVCCDADLADHVGLLRDRWRGRTCRSS